MPTTARVARIHEYGPPEVLRFEDIVVGEPGDDEVGDTAVRHIDTSSSAAASTPVVWVAAAALAALSDEPMPARFVAAAVTNSGVAITKDMAHLRPRHDRCVYTTAQGQPVQQVIRQECSCSGVPHKRFQQRYDRVLSD